MSKDKTTLADVQPGGRARLGDQALSTSEEARRYVAEFFATQLRRHDFGDYIRTELAADFACALAQHLSAQPSPGGQGDLKSRFTEWAKANSYNPATFASGRFMGDGVQIAWEAVQALAARQPVGEESEYLAELQAAVKLGGMEVTERADEDGPFPLMLVWEGTIKPVSPPAQAVDLGPVRVLADHAAGRINHANNGLCPDEVEGHDTRDPDCPVCRALIDSQAVGK